MNASELIKELNAKLVTNDDTLENEYSGIYVGDLLSNVMANVQEDNLLITIMCNLNTIAVASLRDVPIIVFCENKKATDEMIDKANELNIAILETSLPAAEVVIKTYNR